MEKNLKNNENNSLMMIIKETVVLILLLLFFFFLKSNTIELFKIPTGSMEPTLYGANDMGKGFGDHLLVLRGAYGLSSRIKVPFVNWRIPLPNYRIMLPGMGQPKVGDVVVFENPTNDKIDYIKRCAGTPGDKIRITEGNLYVNDKIFTNSPAQAQYVYYTNEGLLGDKFNVVKNIVNKISNFERSDSIKDTLLINGKPYRTVEKEILNRTSKIKPIFDDIVSEIIVPTNSFFMLGDNSARSADSRYWGFVPLDLVKGRAWCVYLPIKRAKMIR
jgi:signal peptidase I